MANQLARSIKDEYLSCSICLEQFRQPKRLPCQHIFCQPCLLQYVTNTLTRDRKGTSVVVHIQCPLCRNIIDVHCENEFNIQTWISGLPNDILINSLLQKLDEHDNDVPQHGIEEQTHCATHGAKLREAYCFTHAKLVCWECAAREHRKCNVDSADKARSVIEPSISSLRKDVCGQLVNAREMCAVDNEFAESKRKVIAELNTLEKDIDHVLQSAKRQLDVLRSEVEQVSRRQLEQRRGFYDVVTTLFEMNHALETISETKDSISMIAKIKSIQTELECAKTELSKMNPDGVAAISNQMSFIADKNMQTFLNVYSGVGFVDADVSQDQSQSQSGAPMSIAHILKRNAPKDEGKS